MDEIIQAQERLNTRLYVSDVIVSDVIPGDTADSTALTCHVPLVTKEEARKVHNVRKRKKAAGDDGISVDLFDDGRETVLEKLAVLFSEC